MAAVSDADRAAAESILAGLSGDLVGWFSVPVIRELDPDNLDPDGTYTGVPRGWVGHARLSVMKAKKFKQALSPITSLRVFDLSSRVPEVDEVSLDALLASLTPPMRRPGYVSRAFVTFFCDGNRPAQSVSPSGVKLQQFNRIGKEINFDHDSDEGIVRSAGDYLFEVRLIYQPVAGVTWTCGVLVNNLPVGPSKQTSDGAAQGALTINGLIPGDRVGIYVRSDAGTHPFKLLAGSKGRISKGSQVPLT